MGYSEAGNYIITNFGVNTKNIIKVVSYICAITLIAVGGYFFIKTRDKK
jgi:hypothetical protein